MGTLLHCTALHTTENPPAARVGSVKTEWKSSKRMFKKNNCQLIFLFLGMFWFLLHFSSVLIYQVTSFGHKVFLLFSALNATATLQEQLMSFLPVRGNTSSQWLHNVPTPPGNSWSTPRLPAASDTSRTCCKNLLNNSWVQSFGNTLDGTHLKAHSVTSSGEKGYCKPCYVISRNIVSCFKSNVVLEN